MTKVGLFAYGEMAPFALKALITGGFDVSWIITPSPDGNSQDASLVEAIANEKGIKIVRTNSNTEIYNLIISKIPDIVVISSYNKILNEKILNLTKFINIHHGDLPRFRGRANINWAIINGRNEIGLTFHRAVPDLDAGNIYAQYMIRISKNDTVKTVYDKVNKTIELNLCTIVEKVIKGYEGKEQKGEPTYCCTRLLEDGLINWQNSSEQIYNLVRALTKPYPGAFTYFENRKLIVWDSEIPKNSRIYEGRIPGRVVEVHKDYGVEVLTGDSSIIIKNINYEKKDLNSTKIIKSVKKTLGINLIEFYEKLQKLLE